LCYLNVDTKISEISEICARKDALSYLMKNLKLIILSDLPFWYQNALSKPYRTVFPLIASRNPKLGRIAPSIMPKLEYYVVWISMELQVSKNRTRNLIITSFKIFLHQKEMKNLIIIRSYIEETHNTSFSLISVTPKLISIYSFSSRGIPECSEGESLPNK